MNQPLQLRSLIPTNAPFSDEQRAWLNGFFQALLAPQPGAAQGALPPAAGAEPAAGPALADNDQAPWHDPGMPMDERLAMAEGKPVALRLMAAMAQQDCGQCGYNCADYANALFLKKEERLTLCAPGGKETARMLKQIAVEIDAAQPTAPAADKGEEAAAPEDVPTIQAAPAGTSRDNPAWATLLSRRRLNRTGSEKTTWHVEFDLSESGLAYEPGDSFGVYPKNPAGLADQIIAMLGARPEGIIGEKTLRDTLIEDVTLSAAPDSLFQLFSYLCAGEQRRKARAFANGEDPDGVLPTMDVLAALHHFPGVRPGAEAFVEALEPLQPRLYSISSSARATPGRISITVDEVRYKIGKRERLGIASTYVGGRMPAGEKLRVYVQKAHGFALPRDPSVPIIMVGPGTGVAPFRSFLQERAAAKAPGRNWLFFGHQRRACDFFYEDELDKLRHDGVLTRLSLAWSRDDQGKFYVQDRMREVGPELWRWLAEGAHFYVCGDAKRMARDVERALVDVIAQWGARSTEEAAAFVKGLKKDGRYQADVY
ncbi:sulfite reductase subunit alpha [Methylovirgula sp. 4M-Z18]|uniref:sulfite reductase subunit alpha n=1 Tax=Methylovirgula sp. 4M-Z18 TaxID=2293567 RepID=UPI000E2FB7BD|nr:sulfite reductase subunit alpha [Methylovirgula sp. 4M-Z18]RFB79862.1 sulfite reductase subunit alpha [Methylovirgula sp. 4M-Z18]